MTSCFSCSAVEPEKEGDFRRLLINTHDGPRSVFRRTVFPVVSLGYGGWNFLACLDELEESLERILRKMPLLRSVLFAGMCKDSICSLMLASRLRRNHPDLTIGVWGCAWADDYTGVTPSCKGVSLSPVHGALRLKEPYRTLLQSADPLRLLDAPSTRGLHLFAFYCRHPYWTMDEEATQRLGNRLTKTYVHDAEGLHSMGEVHTRILSLTRMQPELVSSWIQEMFRLMETGFCNENNVERGIG